MHTRLSKAVAGQVFAGRPISRPFPMLACCFTLGLALAGSGVEPDLLLAIGAALLALGVVADEDPKRKIKADVQRDPDGNARAFTLSLGEEKVTLEPDRAWSQVDIHKWVTRGLIEAPQSFHVLHDGSVGINGEKIHPGDPEGSAKLEHEINKRHALTLAHKAPASPAARLAATPAAAPRPSKVLFKVRLDHQSHLMVECLRGAERAETGLRGLPTLIQNGLMLKPANLHVDPLQRVSKLTVSGLSAARRAPNVFRKRSMPDTPQSEVGRRNRD